MDVGIAFHAAHGAIRNERNLLLIDVVDALNSDEMRDAIVKSGHGLPEPHVSEHAVKSWANFKEFWMARRGRTRYAVARDLLPAVQAAVSGQVRGDEVSVYWNNIGCDVAGCLARTLALLSPQWHSLFDKGGASAVAGATAARIGTVAQDALPRKKRATGWNPPSFTKVPYRDPGSADFTVRGHGGGRRTRSHDRTLPQLVDWVMSTYGAKKGQLFRYGPHEDLWADLGKIALLFEHKSELTTGELDRGTGQLIRYSRSIRLEVGPHVPVYPLLVLPDSPGLADLVRTYPHIGLVTYTVRAGTLMFTLRFLADPLPPLPVKTDGQQ